MGPRIAAQKQMKALHLKNYSIKQSGRKPSPHALSASILRSGPSRASALLAPSTARLPAIVVNKRSNFARNFSLALQFALQFASSGVGTNKVGSKDLVQVVRVQCQEYVLGVHCLQICSCQRMPQFFNAKRLAVTYAILLQNICKT